AEDGIRDFHVTGVQTCALPIFYSPFFKEYIPAEIPKPTELLAKLNANENPYGPSPKAIKALQDMAGHGNRYAWMELFDLIDKIRSEERRVGKECRHGCARSK